MLSLGASNYRLIPLRVAVDGQERVVGGLVLPEASAFTVPSAVLRALAGRIGAQRGALH